MAWVDAWETDVSRMRGVQLGLEEATDLARLLQRSFEVVPLAARDLANDPAIAALEMRPDTELRGVRIYLGPARDAPAGDPALFAVASPPARRQLALARFAAGAGARATLRVVDWHPSLVRFGAQQLNQRFERRFGARMDEDAWVGWLGVKLVSEAAFRSGAGRDELASAIAGASFDGHKGIPLRFANGVLEQPVYVVRGDQVVGEDPPA